MKIQFLGLLCSWMAAQVVLAHEIRLISNQPHVIVTEQNEDFPKITRFFYLYPQLLFQDELTFEEIERLSQRFSQEDYRSLLSQWDSAFFKKTLEGIISRHRATESKLAFETRFALRSLTLLYLYERDHKGRDRSSFLVESFLEIREGEKFPLFFLDDLIFEKWMLDLMNHLDNERSLRVLIQFLKGLPSFYLKVLLADIKPQALKIIEKEIQKNTAVEGAPFDLLNQIKEKLLVLEGSGRSEPVGLKKAPKGVQEAQRWPSTKLYVIDLEKKLCKSLF